MKANLTLERIGGSYDGIPPMLIAMAQVGRALGDPTFKDGIGVPKYRDWVAEIVGFDPVYKYERRFLHGKPDYARANSAGTRGVYANYILESGHIYEVKSPQSWEHSSRYFVEATEDGEVIIIDEGRVIECLRSRSESTSVPRPDSE